MAWFRRLLAGFRHGIHKLGAQTVFLGHIIRCIPYALAHPVLVIRQVHNAGVLSLVIIMTSGFFVGLVLGLQLFDTLNRFRQESVLGATVALSLFKELGPVITGLLFAGRAGTALTSEIGLMKATDQLSAMEVMAVDPVARVVAPRFLGGVVALPLLTVIFNAVAILGAFIIGVTVMGVDEGAFWEQMREYVDLEDVMEGVYKSLVFGVAASLIAVFEGFNALPTAEGVGRATTRTVVNTAGAILMLDYIITGLLI